MQKIIAPLLLGSLCAYAHFGLTMPSSNIVEEQKDSNIKITYAFMHPFEQSYMKMEKPINAGVFSEGKLKKITQDLKKEKETWVSDFKIEKPAVFQFFVEPKPYFEPAEGKFIKHLTKSFVEGYGAGDGWDKAIGLKAEIIPLTRPFGLYRGNLFQGKVLYKGKIVKNCEVEVEFYNDKGFKAPSDTHVTQVVKTDENGIFSFTMPQSGWWGFAALIEDDLKLKHGDKKYPVELGAVLWVRADEWKK
ncbi:MAG: hypothetical protein CR967_01630 [Proteobacteria bacterium]|nr:MAG: hypothetical protein CR967_01630 [Pseudomonadota bacterium]